jgi:Na+-driven multidrug efflux pump
VGTFALAAYTIVRQVERILETVNFGFAITTSVIVGKTVGAGNFNKAYKYGKTLNIAACIIGTFTSIVLFISIPGVLSIIKLSPASMDFAFIMLVVESTLLWLKSFNMTNGVGVLRGGGDGRFVLVFDIGTLWVGGLPIALIIGLIIRMPPQFILAAFIFEEVFKAAVGLGRFRSKKWINDLTR